MFWRIMFAKFVRYTKYKTSIDRSCPAAAAHVASSMAQLVVAPSPALAKIRPSRRVDGTKILQIRLYYPPVTSRGPYTYMPASGFRPVDRPGSAYFGPIRDLWVNNSCSLPQPFFDSCRFPFQLTTVPVRANTNLVF